MTLYHRENRTKYKRTTKRRRAMALLVVLVLVMLAAFSAYSFMFSMESQYRDSRLFEEQLNSQQAAKSGMEIAAAILDLPYELRLRNGGLTNNPELFCGRTIEPIDSNSLQADRLARWQVSIIAPDLTSVDLSSAATLTDKKRFLFGMENESAKIPIGALAAWEKLAPGHARRALMNLPNATEDSVDLFLDSMGIQSSKSSGARTIAGSETGSVGIMHQTERSENQLMQWIGGDLNCNYRQDLFESAWSGRAPNRSISKVPAANSSPTRQLQSTSGSFAAAGWQRYLTKFSGYRNLTRAGEPRIDLNQIDLRALHQQLVQRWPAPLADYVILYRQFGAMPKHAVSSSTSSNGPRNLGSSSSTTRNRTIAPSSQASLPITANANNTGVQAEQLAIAPNFSLPAVHTIISPLDLVGVTTEVSDNSTSTAGKSDKRRIPSPFQAESLMTSNYLSMLLDDVSVRADPYIADRIDISDAPLVVLISVPGMDNATAEAIVQRRQSRVKSLSGNEPDGTIGWLLQEGVVDLAKLTQIEPYLAGRSDVYSCQVVGFRDDRSAVYRTTLIIDARQQPANLRDLQNWHNWDRGFTSEELRESNSSNQRAVTNQN